MMTTIILINNTKKKLFHKTKVIIIIFKILVQKFKLQKENNFQLIRKNKPSNQFLNSTQNSIQKIMIYLT